MRNFLNNSFSSTISSSPTSLEIEPSRHCIHIQNLSCKVEVLLNSWFHCLGIHLTSINSSSSHEFIPRTTFWEYEWDSFTEKLGELFSIWSRDWRCKSILNMRKIIGNKYFYKATRKFLCKNAGDEFFWVILELFFEEFLPRSKIHIEKGSEVCLFLIIFIDRFPSQFRWENECKWSGDSKMCQKKWSGKFYFLVILSLRKICFIFEQILRASGWQRKKDSSSRKSDSRELMHPRFSREKARKRRSECCDSMSKTFCEGISITSRSCMSISISPCRNHENIRFILSFWSGDEEFSLSLSLRGIILFVWMMTWQSSHSRRIILLFLDCFAPQGYFQRFAKGRPRNDRNPFPIMQTDSIAMFREYLFEHFHYLTSIIRDRKNTIIRFTFKRNPMELEPLTTLFRRKLSESLLDEFTSTSVFREKDLFIFDSCGEIASTSARDNYFFPRRSIFLEQMDMKVARIWRFENCCRSHDSCSSSSDDSDSMHTVSTIERNAEK